MNCGQPFPHAGDDGLRQIGISQIGFGLLTFLLYNSCALDGCSSMVRMKFSVTLCLLAFSVQFSSPLVACIKNCHSGTRRCHFVQQHETNSQACPHSKSTSGFAMEAKPACDCAIEAHQTPAKETVFTLDFSRTEISKPSLADFDFSSKTVPNPLEAHLHGPPLSLALTEQNTFLLNSNLRI